jgi:hypothetical protein
VIFALSACAQTRPVTSPPSNPARISNNEFKFLHFIPGAYLQMEVDALDNIYLLTPGYQLKKLDSNRDSVAVFNDVKRYGNPSYIDVSNPFKVLVYYKNFSTAVILDRLLTARNTINFRKQEIFSVKAITTSYDNNIWLFDEQDFKLKKIDDDGKLLFESNDMRLLVENVPLPLQITDSENFVYLYDSTKGFYVFDYYGAFKNNLPFVNWKAVSISNTSLYGFAENELYSYSLKTATLKKYRLPEFIKDYIDIKAINGKLYLLKKDGLEVYQVL